jgi:hypothetical protein
MWGLSSVNTWQNVYLGNKRQKQILSLNRLTFNEALNVRHKCASQMCVTNVRHKCVHPHTPGYKCEAISFVVMYHSQLLLVDDGRTGSLHLGPCIRALCAPHWNLQRHSAPTGSRDLY